MDFVPNSLFAHVNDLFDPTQPVWNALKHLNTYLCSLPLGKIEGEVHAQAVLINPEQIYIGRNAVVEAGAYIAGPAYIGEECSIRHGAYLRGNVFAERRAVIGHASEAKNAIFLEGAQAGHFAYVGDSILGRGVNLGAGTKCANLRFDRKNVRVKGIDTGLRKLGAIFGDGAQTGCNVVTNPGTIMEKGSVAAPCESVYGIISASD